MNDRNLCIIIVITLALLLSNEVLSASSIIVIKRRHMLKKLMYATSCSTTLMYPKHAFAAADNTKSKNSVLDEIDWNAPKSFGLNTERMCDGINDSIRETSWLVTGLGCPSYFSDGFVYQASDEQNGASVRIKGYKAYCRWVNNQRYSSEDIKPLCDLICCSVTAQSTITALWRLGYANNSNDEKRSKVYLSTFTTNNDQGGLVISQNDRVLIERNAPSGDELRAKCNWYSCMPESLL